MNHLLLRLVLRVKSVQLAHSPGGLTVEVGDSIGA